MAMDETLQRKLRDLGRAVFEAISESPDVSEAMDLIRAEGYSLSMQVNCKRGADKGGAGERPLSLLPSRLGESSNRALDPAFRIHGDDLSFLRSIGIDPTRRARRRR